MDQFAKRSKRTADRVVYHYAWTSEVSSIRDATRSICSGSETSQRVTFCRAEGPSPERKGAPRFRARRATRYPPSVNRLASADPVQARRRDQTDGCAHEDASIQTVALALAVTETPWVRCRRFSEGGYRVALLARNEARLSALEKDLARQKVTPVTFRY